MSCSFQFKQFAVSQEASAMKVGTDGVLLGAWVSLRGDERRILDVGTGTGLIALMLAQRTAPAQSRTAPAQSPAPCRLSTRDQGPAPEAFRDAAEPGSPESLRSSLREAVQQVSEAMAPMILGIDIDPMAAREAAGNFAASPWANRLSALPVSVQSFLSEWEQNRPLLFPKQTSYPQSGTKHPDFVPETNPRDVANGATSRDAYRVANGVAGEPAHGNSDDVAGGDACRVANDDANDVAHGVAGEPGGGNTSDVASEFVCGEAGGENPEVRSFDLIVSNPPFFAAEVAAPDARRSAARQSGSLPPAELLAAVRKLLSPSGRLAVIYPLGEAAAFRLEAEAAGLYLSRQTQVITTPGQPPKRLLMEFSRTAGMPRFDDLVIGSAEYRNLTGDFYL